MTAPLVASSFLFASAAVLIDAAVAKLRVRTLPAGGLTAFGRPFGAPPARALAILEACAGVLLVLLPIPAAALAAAVIFAAFAVIHADAWRRGAGDCGCLGVAAASPVRALKMTAAAAGAGFALAGASTADAAATGPIVGQPVATVLVGLATGVAAAALWRHLFTDHGAAASPPPPTAPEPVRSASERLTQGAALFLERRLTRRTALQRIALAGSAFCVAPLRYLLYPGSALAVLLPDQCNRGLCTDGYTAFCCEFGRGVNTCPAGTFTGGWWMCTDYPGRRLCAEQGIRYYLDCNRLPGHHFPGGCQCARNRCDHRRVACNVFRYGQCNTQIHEVTEVVCRVVLCENPSQIPELHCGSSLAVDDAVCRHDAPCLQPAVELTGASGV